MRPAKHLINKLSYNTSINTSRDLKRLRAQIRSMQATLTTLEADLVALDARVVILEGR